MGTWSLPQTKQQAEKLSKLLEKPLSLRKAEDKLYHLTGDDSLFDEFFYLRKEHGNKYDCRDEVKNFVKEIIKRYKKQPKDFRKPFEPEALEILKACLK